MYTPVLNYVGLYCTYITGEGGWGERGDLINVMCAIINLILKLDPGA